MAYLITQGFLIDWPKITRPVFSKKSNIVTFYDALKKRN